MIAWREKLTAFAVHFLVTLAVALIAAGIIFLVWYPEPFGAMLGGAGLFFLVSGCDLALGPLISLVIYTSRKSRRTLITDYAVVGILQLAALAYGIYVVAIARPIYLVFSKDRIEVIQAQAIEDTDLAQAKLEEYRDRPWFGPELVAAVVDPQDHDDALFHGLAGKDVSVRPKFYMPYETQIDVIKGSTKPLSDLVQRFPTVKSTIESTLKDHDLTIDQVGWLPVQSQRGFWTALIDARSGYPFDYLPIDPY